MNTTPHAHMDNRAMAYKLKTGAALDVHTEGVTIGRGRYRLRRFVADVDYCDAQAEAWIWSIGRRYADDAIIASTGSELYQNPDFECLFLR
jgi:hypothetical protein